MNKKLLALAIAGALAAPLAAQAEVSIYGVAHVSVDSLDNDGPGLAPDGSAVPDRSGVFVSSNSSRIGFKGSEDLGAGLKAIWQIENDVRLDEAGGQFASRNSFLGLAGGWGAALFGRHDTPMKIVGRKVDFFGDTIGDSRNITLPTAELRPNNVMAYASPNMSGLQALVAYVPDEGVDNGDAFSVNVTYGNGPLWVGAAYDSHSKGLLGATNDESLWRLAASYEMGAFKVAGMYDNYSDALGISGLDSTAWGLGGAFSMGNNVVKAQYYTIDSFDGAPETGSSMWAIGLDHNFSKSTTGYLAYASTDNDDNVARSMAAGGHGDTLLGEIPGGGNPTGFSVGLIHKF